MNRFILTALLLAFISGIFAQTAVQPSGNGTENDPYQISSWQNLYWISQDSTNWDKHYIQTNNITFPDDIVAWNDSTGWKPIGYFNSNLDNYPFWGTYDGQSHTISNLYIKHITVDLSPVGLFGHITNATISNLNLINLNVRGRLNVGGLVGDCFSSTIENCSCSGNVRGTEVIGVLAGYLSESNVNLCYSSGTVAGVSLIGGLVGTIEMNSTVSNCFSTADHLNNGYYGGGLAGSSTFTSSVINCYSTGHVYGNSNIGGLIGGLYDSSVSNSFWDVETSEQTTGIGVNDNGTLNNVLGKTSVEMKTQSTFTDAGWDFESIWQIFPDLNSGYPVLHNYVANSEHIQIPEPNDTATLYQAYPNPFNPSTTISFNLKATSFVKIDIFNIRGNKVCTLLSEHMNSGNHSLIWNGKDLNNKICSSGIYFYQMTAGNYQKTRKLLMLK